MAFDGFPRNVRATPAPDPLFNSLLEEINDLGELKTTLRLVWLLGQKRGSLRFLREQEILTDATLARSLRSLGGDPADRIRQALALVTTRGTVLLHSPEGNPEDRYYLLNTDSNRRQLAARSGMAMPDGSLNAFAATAPGIPDASPGTGSTIYDLYENNIGTFGPLVAEQLAEAEERYPPNWIEEAFKLAVFNNKRSWGYIAAILRRWGAEGRGGALDPPTEAPQLIQHHPGVGVQAGATLWEAEGRNHGEPGRHSETGDGPRQPPSRQRR